VTATTPRPRDALPRSWVDRTPARLQPYLRLMRADRPIGTWLLFWPCAWSTVLPMPTLAEPWPDLELLLWFFAGSFVMRGAGCTWNDITDRDIDAKVARTAGRPIPSGAVSVRAALVFLALQLLAGLVVLLQMRNGFAMVLGLAAMVPVLLYPFAKRVTDWPQAVLGLTFNWGALMSWAALTGGLAAAPLLLYAGAILWTIGYDTIYAHQDADDDAVLGVRSTALLFGPRTKPMLVLFYGGAVLAWAAAAWAAHLGPGVWAGLALTALHLARQIGRLDIADAANCLAVFRANRETGLLLFLSLLAGAMTA